MAIEVTIISFLVLFGGAIYLIARDRDDDGGDTGIPQGGSGKSPEGEQ